MKEAASPQAEHNGRAAGKKEGEPQPLATDQTAGGGGGSDSPQHSKKEGRQKRGSEREKRKSRERRNKAHSPGGTNPASLLATTTGGEEGGGGGGEQTTSSSSSGTSGGPTEEDQRRRNQLMNEVRQVKDVRKRGRSTDAEQNTKGSSSKSSSSNTPSSSTRVRRSSFSPKEDGHHSSSSKSGSSKRGNNNATSPRDSPPSSRHSGRKGSPRTNLPKPKVEHSFYSRLTTTFSNQFQTHLHWLRQQQPPPSQHHQPRYSYQHQPQRQPQQRPYPQDDEQQQVEAAAASPSARFLADKWGRIERMVGKHFDASLPRKVGKPLLLEERYVLLRAETLSVDFFSYAERIGFQSTADSTEFAKNLLYDLAHSIGRSDASAFLRFCKAKEGRSQVVPRKDWHARLVAGCCFCAHTGWAKVHIVEASEGFVAAGADARHHGGGLGDSRNPLNEAGFYVVYDQYHAFEADTWRRASQKQPKGLEHVCVSSAGYYSGWCSRCFGMNLVSAQILCRARGDKVCRFIMASPRWINQHLQNYLLKNKSAPDSPFNFMQMANVSSFLRNVSLSGRFSSLDSSASEDGRNLWLWQSLQNLLRDTEKSLLVSPSSEDNCTGCYEAISKENGGDKEQTVAATDSLSSLSSSSAATMHNDDTTTNESSTTSPRNASSSSRHSSFSEETNATTRSSSGSIGGGSSKGSSNELQLQPPQQGSKHASRIYLTSSATLTAKDKELNQDEGDYADAASSNDANKHKEKHSGSGSSKEKDERERKERENGGKHSKGQPLFPNGEVVPTQRHSMKMNAELQRDAKTAKVLVEGTRHVFVRAKMLSCGFYSLMEELFGPDKESMAMEYAANFLYDLGRYIGKLDRQRAKEDSKSARQGSGNGGGSGGNGGGSGGAGVRDRVFQFQSLMAEKGWGSGVVEEISADWPKQRSLHLVFSVADCFEAECWKGKEVRGPMCVMTAGYAAGWCSACTSTALICVEVSCKAMGHSSCRFVVSHPKRIEKLVRSYVDSTAALASASTSVALSGSSHPQQQQSGNSKSGSSETASFLVNLTVLNLTCSWPDLFNGPHTKEKGSDREKARERSKESKHKEKSSSNHSREDLGSKSHHQQHQLAVSSLAGQEQKDKTKTPLDTKSPTKAATSLPPQAPPTSEDKAKRPTVHRISGGMTMGEESLSLGVLSSAGVISSASASVSTIDENEGNGGTAWSSPTQQQSQQEKEAGSDSDTSTEGEEEQGLSRSRTASWMVQMFKRPTKGFSFPSKKKKAQDKERKKAKEEGKASSNNRKKKAHSHIQVSPTPSSLSASDNRRSHIHARHNNMIKSSFELPLRTKASLLKDVPDLPICKLERIPGVKTLKGPTKEETQVSWFDANGVCAASGRTISTYPNILALGIRQGDPICDCFAAVPCHNGAILCVCDGCGWGNAPAEAARRARATFVRSLKELAIKPVSDEDGDGDGDGEEESNEEERGRRDDGEVTGTSTPWSLRLAESDSAILSRNPPNSSSSEMHGREGGGSLIKAATTATAHAATNATIPTIITTKTKPRLTTAAATQTGGRRFETLSDAAEMLLELVVKAHNNIIEDKDNIFDAGTTTLLAGLVLQVNRKELSTTARSKMTRETIPVPLIELSSSEKTSTRSITPLSSFAFSSSSSFNISSASDITASSSSFASASSASSTISLLPLPDDREASHASSSAEKDLQKEQEQKEWEWVWLGVSIGDCKAFRWSSRTNLVSEISMSSRGNAKLASDCGGRIGPTLANGEPDLANLTLSWGPCHEGDLIWLVSDGVYDNLDPQYNGIQPSGLGHAAATWDEISSSDAHLLKNEYLCRIMQDRLFGDNGTNGREEEHDGDEDDETKHRKNEGAQEQEEGEERIGEHPQAEKEEHDDATAQPQPPRLNGKDGAKEKGEEEETKRATTTAVEVTNGLVAYCQEHTLVSRDFMEQNPGLPLPKDYKTYPGKLDHTTCVCIRVGYLR
ncbi:PPM-type phosphatase domain-containing protein [Balamuthia mandrillaris]